METSIFQYPGWKVSSSISLVLFLRGLSGPQQRTTHHLMPGSVASLVAQMEKHLPVMQETQVQSLGWDNPLEKEMATHSSTLAWKISWTEESGRLQSMGSQRVRHDWATSLSLSVESWRPPWNCRKLGIQIRSSSFLQLFCHLLKKKKKINQPNNRNLKAGVILTRC